MTAERGPERTGNSDRHKSRPGPRGREEGRPLGKRETRGGHGPGPMMAPVLVCQAHQRGWCLELAVGEPHGRLPRPQGASERPALLWDARRGGRRAGLQAGLKGCC